MATTRHDFFMQEAIQLAKEAAQKSEVPVGALIINNNGHIIGQGMNLTESGNDATLHAEMIALRQAAQSLGHWRLKDCTLYVTLEPCPMCAGAMVQAQLGSLVYGAPDSKAGAAGSLFNITQSPLLNHQIQVIGCIKEAECAKLLQDFFRSRRK